MRTAVRRDVDQSYRGWGLHGGLGCVASVGLTGHVMLQEVEESHPDLLQLPQDLELPARAAG